MKEVVYHKSIIYVILSQYIISCIMFTKCQAQLTHYIHRLKRFIKAPNVRIKSKSPHMACENLANLNLTSLSSLASPSSCLCFTHPHPSTLVLCDALFFLTRIHFPFLCLLVYTYSSLGPDTIIILPKEHFFCDLD